MSKLTQQLLQAERARVLLLRYQEYARGLGCQVLDDMIVVETADQERLLKEWWDRETAL